MLKMSYAGCPGTPAAISVQFTHKMSDAAKNRQKLTKTPPFKGSRSFKVIDVDTNKKLVTSACCIATKLSQNTAVQEHPFPLSKKRADISF